MSGVPRLTAFHVDAEAERRTFLDRHGAALRDLLERGSYLERAEVQGILELPVPGVDELAALFRLVELSSVHERVVIDTAPTGHTLRLVTAPGLAEQWLDALEELDSRHEIVAARLSGSIADDDPSRMIRSVRQGLRDLRERLTDRRKASFLLVTLAESVVEAETGRFLAALAAAGIHVSAIVVNRAEPGARPPAAPDGTPLAFAPVVAPAPTGIAGLRSFARSVRRSPPASRAVASGSRQNGVRTGVPYRPPLDRGLYLVAGKGGVGKTTVASALSVLLARDAGRDVLLLSTDPAGSLGDVWGAELGSAERAAPGEPRIRLRQLDAGAVWRQFRDSFRAEPTARSGELLNGGTGSGADGDVLVRLLDIGPPGIDELMALVEISERIDSPDAGVLVLDTAPTGHLLRLLQAPEDALQWSHAAMRLLLKYREVIGLGAVAEDVLKLSRRVRALRDRLRDASDRFITVVALPDPLNVAEAERLLIGLRSRGLAADALLVNRVPSDPNGDAGAEIRALAALPDAPPLAAAPVWSAGPCGADELSRFAAEWHSMEPDPG